VSVAGGAIGDVLHGHHVPGGCRGPVEVVLAQEDDRELPDRRQVERFVEAALVAGAVAEEAEGDLVRAAHPGGKPRAGGERHAGAHDPRLAHDTHRVDGEVHRAALALADAGPLPHELRHQRRKRGTLADRVAMRAMCAEDEIVAAQCHAGPGDRGLLSDAEVRRARDEPGAHLLHHGLLEQADLQHALV
jgi:hypothetical protein